MSKIAMKAMGPYLNSVDVAQRYRISKWTLGRWVKSETMGFPKPFRINRRQYFKLADLEAWDDSLTVQATT